MGSCYAESPLVAEHLLAMALRILSATRRSAPVHVSTSAEPAIVVVAGPCCSHCRAFACKNHHKTARRGLPADTGCDGRSCRPALPPSPPSAWRAPQELVDLLVSCEHDIGPNIQADEDGYYWLLNGVERRDRNDALDIVESDLKDISATNLRQMYRRLQKHQGPDYSLSDIVIHAGEIPSEFDLRDLPELPASDVKISFEEGEILLVIECYLSIPSRDDEGTQPDITALNAPPPGLNVAALIAPLLSRKRLSLVDVDTYNYSDDYWQLSVEIGFNPRSRMLSDLYYDALEVKALIEASAGGVTHKTVAELIRGGHV